mmetsp:Transcript_39026/g.87270  ORF Transcript_39026/g.87270 Transcript_39026/m.87270 type:complete len:203 (-) Transcript_39026:7-615(-)
MRQVYESASSETPPLSHRGEVSARGTASRQSPTAKRIPPFAQATVPRLRAIRRSSSGSSTRWSRVLHTTPTSRSRPVEGDRSRDSTRLRESPQFTSRSSTTPPPPPPAGGVVVTTAAVATAPLPSAFRVHSPQRSLQALSSPPAPIPPGEAAARATSSGSLEAPNLAAPAPAWPSNTAANSAPPPELQPPLAPLACWLPACV